MAATAFAFPPVLLPLRFNARAKLPLPSFPAFPVVQPPLTAAPPDRRRRIHTSGGFTDPSQGSVSRGLAEPEPERHLQMIFKVVKEYLEREEFVLVVYQLPHTNELIPMTWSSQHQAWSAEVEVPISCPLLFSFFCTKDLNGDLKSTPSLPKMYQANSSLKSITMIEEWVPYDNNLTLPEDLHQRSVPVSFSVSKDWVEGEELYLSIGEEWLPNRTVPMAWSGEDNCWCAEMEIPVGKRHYFHYLVKKQGSEVLFKPPTPHRHLETWKGLKKMSLTEEWLPTDELAEVWESGSTPTRDGYVSDEY